VKAHQLVSPAILSLALIGLTACSPDDLPTSQARSRPDLRGALTDAQALIAQAVAGRRVRGEQDDMLRREVALPGFGGFYIDSLDRMVVYMKAGSNIPDTVVRRVLVAAYEHRPEQRIQQLMPEVAKARIVVGDFALSELISFENRISHSTVTIPGYTGTGTSLITNRVVVGFTDTASVEAGLSAIRSLGIPAKAVVAEVWGQIRVLSSFDQADPVRPVRGGLLMTIHNTTQYPWVYAGQAAGKTYYTTQASQCSLGFNARWYSPDGTVTDYMMSSSHCVNSYRGINGVLGDTVAQPRNPTMESPFYNVVGFVAVNEPWLTDCGENPYDGSTVDYCIDGDVMLIRLYYTPGLTERKVATSEYEGLNGNNGTMKINNYYPIQSVGTPEWISTQRYGVHKSGAVTGTTTGAMQIPATHIITRLCWTLANCPTPGSNSGGVQIGFVNVVKVAGAGIGWGDSGGVVFAGNGSPYYAMGITVAGSGFKSTDGKYCTSGTLCSFWFTPWSAIQQSIRYATGVNGTLNPITTQ
jgi:hypothetical protein